MFLNGTYDELTVATRVSSHASWIDSTLSGYADVMHWDGASHVFTAESHWNGAIFSETVPGKYDTAVFDQSGTYTISFHQDSTNAEMVVRNGNVTFDLDDRAYTIDGGISVGDSASHAKLNVGGGDLVATNVTIGKNAGSSGELLVIGGNAHIHVGADMFIGESGTGTFTQSVDASVTVGGEIYLGVLGSGRGTYNLSGGDLISAETRAGHGGYGTFNHTGGTNTVSGDLSVGGSGGGEYNLSGGGQLVAANEHVGNFGDGEFAQTGGTNTVGDDLYLGSHTGVNGTYTILAGDLNVADSIRVGQSGTGAFTQNLNASVTAGGQVYLGVLGTAQGTYNLSGGDLDSTGTHAGYGGYGTFNHSGGTHTISGDLSVGGSGGGEYNLSGSGQLQAVDEHVGNHGTGAFVQTGGTNTVGDDLYLGSNPVASGTYTMSGGTLNVGDSTEVGRSGSGTFNQSGGTHTISGNLLVGGSGAGEYNLSGSGQLVAAYEYVGHDDDGEFTQTGGTNTVSNYLYLGSNSGADGTYTISGGTLNVANLIEIGRDGTGTFNLNGGTVVTKEFRLGNGTFNSAAGSTLRVNSLTGFGGNFSTAGTLQINGSYTVNDGESLSVGEALEADKLTIFEGGTVSVGGDLVVGDTWCDAVKFGDGNSYGGTLIVGGAFKRRLGNGTLEGSYSPWESFGSGNLIIDGGSWAPSSLEVMSGGPWNSANSQILTVRNGGNVTVVNSITIAKRWGSDASGRITVEGAGSEITGLGLYVAGGGTLSIEGGGNVIISGGAELGSGPGVAYAAGYGPGFVTVAGAGSSWTIDGTLKIGSLQGVSSDRSSLDVGDGGTVEVHDQLLIRSLGDVNLAGGNIIASAIDIDSGATLTGYGRVTGGLGMTSVGSIIAVEDGNLTIGDASRYSVFNYMGELSVGQWSATLETKGFASLGALTTMDGGTLSADNGIALGLGRNLVGSGSVDAKVSASFGSTIEATGDLSLGDSSSIAGFTSDGELYTAEHTVTLHDANQAVLGSLTQLGTDIADGTLVADNGLVVEFGKNIVGRGIVDTPDDELLPLTNNGQIIGDFPGAIELTGHVDGVGTLTNVTVTGTLSPGFSPVRLHATNLEIAGSGRLVMELGGLAGGSEYDQLDVAGDLHLGGTLQVSLIGGFAPDIGDTFDILDFAVGALDGTEFDDLELPELTGRHGWDTSGLYSEGQISVKVMLAGDTNVDWDVNCDDIANFVAVFGSEGDRYTDFNEDGRIDLTDFAILRANFGVGVVSAPDAEFGAAAPEPATLSLLSLSGLVILGRRRRSSRPVRADIW